MRRERADVLSAAGLRFAPADTALVLVDVEKMFFEDPLPDRVAYRIARLADAFRRAGTRVIAVHCDNTVNPREVDFLHYTPAAGDIVVQKKRDDAFFKPINAVMADGVLQRNVSFLYVLKGLGVENIAFCGGWFDHCLTRTAVSAAAHFNVCVMPDLTVSMCQLPPDDGDKNRLLKGAPGVVYASPASVLRHLQAAAL